MLERWLGVSRPSSKAALGEEEPLVVTLVVTLWSPAVKLELKAVRTDRQKSDN